MMFSRYDAGFFREATDAREREKGIDPQDGPDGAIVRQPGGYTNLEIYLNELVP